VNASVTESPHCGKCGAVTNRFAAQISIPYAAVTRAVLIQTRDRAPKGILLTHRQADAEAVLSGATVPALIGVKRSEGET